MKGVGYNMIDEAELQTMILEKIYYDQYKKKHSEFIDENELILNAFPREWIGFDDFSQKVVLLKKAIEKNLDLEEIILNISESERE